MPALKGICAVLLCCILGCAVGPNFERPKPPSIERYTPGQRRPRRYLRTARSSTLSRVQRSFRTGGGCLILPSLTQSVKEAIANNQNLQAAQASLRQSQDILRAGYGVFYPQVNAGFDASRQKTSSAATGGNTPSSIFNLFTLSATVSYALDVFGGERRAVESLGAQVDFQHALVQASLHNPDGQCGERHDRQGGLSRADQGHRRIDQITAGTGQD